MPNYFSHLCLRIGAPYKYSHHKILTIREKHYSCIIHIRCTFMGREPCSSLVNDDCAIRNHSGNTSFASMTGSHTIPNIAKRLGVVMMMIKPFE